MDKVPEVPALELITKTILLKDKDIEVDYSTPVRLVVAPDSVSLALINRHNEPICTAVLELTAGQLILNVWNMGAHLDGEDPSHRITMCIDVMRAFASQHIAFDPTKLNPKSGAEPDLPASEGAPA